MDFLEKLNFLMNKNNLNKSTLSKACDIPYTTIDGWYKKGYEGLKLSTLRKLANFFETSLDYWANDDSQLTTPLADKTEPPNKNTSDALKILDSLSPELQDYAMQQLKGLLEIQKCIIKQGE